MDSYTPTGRTEVRRLAKRGVYDKAQIHAILDEGYLCHVGFVVDGQPYVIPTGYARSGDRIYIHGSAASRMLRALGVSSFDELPFGRGAGQSAPRDRSR